jgi:hypothetical protein
MRIDLTIPLDQEILKKIFLTTCRMLSRTF